MLTRRQRGMKREAARLRRACSMLEKGTRYDPELSRAARGAREQLERAEQLAARAA